jgi:long-chain acyl-CoA synthetase
VSRQIESVEAHLCASMSLIVEACVLPQYDLHAPNESVVVVVPDSAALSAQKVPQALKRIREALDTAAASAPYSLRVAALVLLEGPLPRTQLGRLAREEIAELARAWPQSVTDETGEHPTARRLLQRLESVLEVRGPLSPSQHLEVDLGLDSLDLLQIRLLLEEEFGVTLRADELWRVQTVGDAVRRAVEVACPPSSSEAPDYTWAARLRQPAHAPLNQRFNMQRRGLNLATAGLAMRFMTAVSRLVFRTELLHAERLPREGPYLLCPTHQSLLDSPLIYATFPYALVHRTVFLAFASYFHTPPLSWLVRRGRLILTGEGDCLLDSLRLAWDGLQRGWTVVIFPEGTCSYRGSILEARPGVGLLACEAQVPIVPVLYEGSGGTCSPHTPGLHAPKIRVTVGEPIPPPAGPRFTRADYQAMADRWREAVQNLEAASARERS